MHTKFSYANVLHNLLYYAHKMYPHIYYIVHTELLGDSEQHIFIVLTMQNCQVLVNQLYLLYHAHKIVRC